MRLRPACPVRGESTKDPLGRSRVTPAKAQHWVPQLYLRPFCSQEDPTRLWVFFRTGPEEPRLMRPEEVCAQNYLYAPVGRDGARDHSVDDKLGGLESLIGDIWPEVAYSTVDLDNASVRKALSLFVATLWLRNPQRIADTARLEERIRAFLRTVPAARYANLTPLNPEQVKAAFAHQILANGRSVAEALLHKRWTVVVADKPIFATCDVPVRVDGARDALLPPAEPESTVTVPLSPTRCLVIKPPDQLPNGYYEGNAEFYQAVNYQTWLAADRYLLSQAQSDTVLRDIMAFADQHGLSGPAGGAT